MHNLTDLLAKTKRMMEAKGVNDILITSDQRLLYNTVVVRWGKTLTYHRLGSYAVKQNLITISRSLEDAPEFVVIADIWHELLHVHFNRKQGNKAHSRLFHIYEERCPQFKDAEKYMRELCLKIYCKKHPKAHIVERNGKTYVSTPSSAPVRSSSVRAMDMIQSILNKNVFHTEEDD